MKNNNSNKKFINSYTFFYNHHNNILTNGLFLYKYKYILTLINFIIGNVTCESIKTFYGLL